MQSRNNLKHIGLALHNYHDSYNCFPAGGIFNLERQAYHGWMTTILPFIDDYPLWSSIDGKEPWDTTKNAGSFLHELPCYENPSEPLPQRSKWEFPLAHYSANSRIMAVNSFTKLESIENAERVFLAGELAGDFLPWGCPYNWRELGSLNDNPPTYGRSTRDGCHFLFTDGRVEFVANEVSADILKKMSGDDLTGFKANSLKIQRPSSFPVPIDALRISWDWEPDAFVTTREDIHGKVTTEKVKKGKNSK
ncbi:DUF1559 family PulG-like putative transporter [Schlesneria paludicola]|uniref:DUF1559 family PulG-like putative transporter n=1 Tax=Schlesneria paludicola TaxID=360056 RepID=UPI0003012923